MIPGSSQPPTPAMHFINRFPPKSSQHYIIIIIMASCMRVPFMLVFHQSKGISAVKRTRFYYCHAYILVSFHVFVFTLSLPCMLKSSALRVGVKTFYNANDISYKWRGAIYLNRSSPVLAVPMQGTFIRAEASHKIKVRPLIGDTLYWAAVSTAAFSAFL